MRVVRPYRSQQRGAVISAVLTAIAVSLSAQNLVTVPFPPQQQWPPDCRTPVVIDIGNQRLTLEGGQFMIVNNAAAYVTNAACFASIYPSTLKVTFANPVKQFEVDGTHLGNFVQIFAAWVDQTSGGTTGFSRAWYPQTPSLQLTYPFSTGDPPATDVSFYNDYPWAWGITSIKIPPPNLDIVTFDYGSGATGDDGKILLSTAPLDTNYPSQYQIRGSSGPQVHVTGTLLDGQTRQPKAGTLYLRVDDPPDTAPYRGADARSGDNDGPPALWSGATNGVAQIQTDPLGHFDAVLTINSAIAGDNYQITGAANGTFSCGNAGCPRSGTFTLWKRIYVEQENMFVSGSFLTDLAQAGTTEIAVENPQPFQNLMPGAQLELVHGQRPGQPGYYFDFVIFSDLRYTPQRGWIVDIDPASRTSRDYGEPRPPGGVQSNSPIALMRDGIGVVAAGTYEANDAYVAPLFASMFIDVQPTRQTVTEIPFVASMNHVLQRYFASQWFQNATGSPYSRIANSNVFHRTVVASSPTFTVAGGFGVELGDTGVGGQSNYSLIFAQTIDTVTRAGPYSVFHALLLNGETTAHETVHFWVHAGGSDGFGHCLQQSYRAAYNCLMHEPYFGPAIADGIVDLHYINHGADSEYMFIRRAADPVPQQ